MTIDQLKNRAAILHNRANNAADSNSAEIMHGLGDIFQHLADWQERVESVKLPPMFAKMMGVK